MHYSKQRIIANMIQADVLQYAGLRADGRKPTELRRKRHKISVFPNVDGSAYLETGLNKVLVMVTGPMEPRKSQDQVHEKGVISVHLATAAFSGGDHRRRRVNDRRSIELETVIRQTFEGCVMLELYPRSEINITLHVLESDGSIVCSLINATSLALMDAGIAMTDMLVACSVGNVRDRFCIDVNQVEQSSGGAYIPLAIKAKSEEVVFLQMDSRLSVESLGDAVSAAVAGCRMVAEYMEAAVKRYPIFFSIIYVLLIFCYCIYLFTASYMEDISCRSR